MDPDYKFIDFTFSKKIFKALTKIGKNYVIFFSLNLIGNKIIFSPLKGCRK